MGALAEVLSEAGFETRKAHIALCGEGVEGDVSEEVLADVALKVEAVVCGDCAQGEDYGLGGGGLWRCLVEDNLHIAMPINILVPNGVDLWSEVVWFGCVLLHSTKVGTPPIRLPVEQKLLSTTYQHPAIGARWMKENA